MQMVKARVLAKYSNVLQKRKGKANGREVCKEKGYHQDLLITMVGMPSTSALLLY